ncbi:MAG: TIGR02266 family protein, partial [Acidobacteriota bacterium]
MSDSFADKPADLTGGDMRHAESRVTLRFERFASFVEEYSSNISLGGVFIKTHKARPVGTEIHFEFKLVDGFRLLHGQGQVVWVRLKDHSDGAPAGMGVRFTAIDESGRQLVLKLLEEQVKSGGAPFEVETVPADAEDSPPALASAPADLPDLSEEPTLIGHVPEVALPEAAGAGGAGGEGFDAPWGEKMPSMPTDLLDEEEDPEVEEAVRSIRPDPALASPAAAAPPGDEATGGDSRPTDEGPTDEDILTPNFALEAPSVEAEPAPGADESPLFELAAPPPVEPLEDASSDAAPAFAQEELAFEPPPEDDLAYPRGAAPGVEATDPGPIAPVEEPVSFGAPAADLDDE